jgi:quercetin dioxygenase-like cupin family protein
MKCATAHSNLRLLLACATLAAAAAHAQGAATPTLDLQPADVRWVPSPVPGVQTAVLHGDLAQAGLYILRVKIAKDSRLMPHTHPDVRYTTVLSGEMLFGFGDTFDAQRMKPYPAGAIIAIPANAPHYVWARDSEVVVQDAGVGPTGSAPLKK